MKKNGGKAKEFFTKLRQIYDWLVAAEIKSEDYLTNKDNPYIKRAGGPTSNKAVLQGHLVIKGFILVFLFTVVILAGLVWYTWRSNRHLKMLETTHFRLLQLSGQIIHIDEVLTMSANMAVETGELKWEERYRKFEPQLDSAIKEVIEMSPEQFMKEAISRTDMANIKLVAMENRAFDLIRQGELETASKLLHSTEYTKQKQVYSAGINEITNAIGIREQARIKKEQRIALIVIVLLIVTMPLIAFIWVAALWILRRYIVERKQAEDALRKYRDYLEESEKKFRAVVETAVTAIISSDIEGKIIFWNKAAEKMFGYAREEIIAKELKTIMPERYRSAHLKGLKRVAETGKTRIMNRSMELAGLRKDGTEFPIELTISVWKMGQEVFFTALLSDITQRKQAEEALLESEQRFRDFFANAPIGFHIFGPNQIITDINDAELDMIGYTHDEIVGKKTWADLIIPAQEEQFKKHWNNIITKGNIRNLEYTLVHKDGYHIDVLLNASSRFDEIGQFVNSCGSVLNITARKQAEKVREKLLKKLASKSEELESIVYVSSHDLRSPLINIQGYSTELECSCKEAVALADDSRIPKEIAEKLSAVLLEDIPESLKYITASAQSMGRLLAGLLKLSRLGQSALEIKSLDIDQMLSEVISSLQFKLKESGAEVRVDKLPPCLGDKTQINQVFTNLLDNAIKYLDPNRKGIIHISGKVAEGMSIYCVEDNGIGIAGPHHKKVFEIFHQLEPQEPAAGQGLGLTIVQRIIDRHNGNVWLKSEPGKGSCFYVAMPHTG